MSTDGVGRTDFERAVLSDVDPRDVDEVIALLHRRRIVWVCRNRGAVRIYRSRPEAGAQHDKRNEASALLSAVAPHMCALARAPSDRDAVRANASRVLALCSAHEVRGLPLPVMRAALWDTFAETAMQSLIWHEPRLHRLSDAMELQTAAPPRPRRLPNGLSLPDRVLAIVCKAGERGAVKRDVLALIRPRISASEVDRLLGEHVAAGRIVSGVMRAHAVGRSATRYFAAGVDLPYVAADGRAVWAAGAPHFAPAQ